MVNKKKCNEVVQRHEQVNLFFLTKLTLLIIYIYTNVFPAIINKKSDICTTNIETTILHLLG
jgi:hypothetical protein